MEERKWALLEEADWHFRRVVRRFVKERDKISVEGISLPGLLILNTIHRTGAQRLGELANQLDFTSGAVTAVCDKLEAAGFAVRSRSKIDRRAIVLDITDTGIEMLKRNEHIGGYMIELLFGSFSQEELGDLICLFERLNDHLDGFADVVLNHSQSLTETGNTNAQTAIKDRFIRSDKYISY